MFTEFFFELRAQGVPVSMNEWYTLLEALERGMAYSSLIGFYYLCRAVLIKSEAYYDKFDLAFARFFEGVETPEDLPEQIWEWLERELPNDHTVRMLGDLKQYDLDTLKQMLAERLAEQTEEHHGGNYWVGTGGTSPFGHSGYHPGGIRLGGESQNRSAVKVAAERRFYEFRDDETLDTRQFQMALRKLRQFTTRLEGAKTELDLDETIEATGKNAGRLELVWTRPRQNAIKVLLLMDSGGSMLSYSQLCNQLFMAVNRSTHFKDLQIFYFHNCIYDWLYLDPSCRQSESIKTTYVLNSLDSDYRVILVGDASMAPSELVRVGGIIDWGLYNEEPGLTWLQRLRRHFEYAVWLNPIPARYWKWAEGAYTIKQIREVFPMHELTVQGLDQAVKALMARKQ
ncbi:MAG: VWA domain-containing protein [Syntrophomonadaceae bacterium]|nr:VWA domain-containing protein [Syntrophomonadaceae bacterium]